MASTLLLALLTMPLAGLASVPEPAGAAVAEPGRITGTITGPGGAPLQGASVSAYRVNCRSGCAAVSATSGADGRYEVRDVPPDTYHLLIQVGHGFVAEYYLNVVDPADATPVVVTPGGTLADVNAQLEHGGHLTGTVTGREGRPLKGIEVAVYGKVPSGWRHLGLTHTDSDGKYDAAGTDGLLGGTYRLRFVDYSEPGYVTEFLNNADTLRGAADVVMAENETVAGLNVRMAWPRKLRNLEAPRIVGNPKAGATLRINPGAWSPAEVKAQVLGWYVGKRARYLGTFAKRLRLVGGVLAQTRGKLIRARIEVSAHGYIPVIVVLTAPGRVSAG